MFQLFLVWIGVQFLSFSHVVIPSESFHVPTKRSGLVLRSENRNKVNLKTTNPNNVQYSDEMMTESNSGLITLSQYLEMKKTEQDLSNIICSSAIACIKISQELQRLPLAKLKEDVMKTNVQGEVQKEMDVIANEIFIDEVQEKVVVLASEEEEDVINGGVNVPDEEESEKIFGYEIAFDPLDGSSNLDVDVPTGTILGIAPHTIGRPFTSSGRCLVAAAYAVYSSSIEFVLSLGESGSDGCAGFTLDQRLLHQKLNDMKYQQNDSDLNLVDCFILSRPNMNCPTNGPYYSLNEGREPDWPDGLRKWIHDAKRGETPLQTTFSSRYICSLCADFHRTLIKGGWAGNPRPHLRLLYEGLPLAHIVEACGGRGSNGYQDLLDLMPKSLHDRTCVFLGSTDVINDLESYGDIQQDTKRYDS